MLDDRRLVPRSALDGRRSRGRRAPTWVPDGGMSSREVRQRQAVVTVVVTAARLAAT